MHEATAHLLQYFRFDHLPRDLQEISMICSDTAQEMILLLPEGPELTTGLRKLLEAKDCFVRAALDIRRMEEAANGRMGKD